MTLPRSLSRPRAIGRPTRSNRARGRRAVRLRGTLTALMAALLLALGGTGTASAHPMATSAVLIDVRSHQVDLEVQLPLDRLSVALGRDLTPQQAAGPQRAALEQYVRRHVAATGTDGARWAVTVSGGRVRTIDGAPHLVEDVTLVPPDGQLTAFSLHYDAIIEQLVTHKAIATVRTQWDAGTTAHDPRPLGVFDFSVHDLRVDAASGSWLHGVTTMGRLGVEHVGSGADHLLFLLMLLVPAPLVARGGRWRRRDSARGSLLRVVHVVSAFAVGHSVTLALATLGVVHPPSAVVETLIAISILVSAIHAIRPLVPGGEALIAAAFGLVHGLAFATLLRDMGLDGGTLASSLLGFNLGIELTQLLVVVLLMPSLYVLSRTTVYPAVRVGIALAGAILAAAWSLDRTGLIAGDPFSSLTDALVGRPLLIAATFAVFAALATLLSRTDLNNRRTQNA